MVRKHCICNEHYNPDKILLKCPSSSCGLWLHEECLISDILEKTYNRLVKGEPAVNGEVKSTEGNLVKKTLFPTEKIKELVTSAKNLRKGSQPDPENKGAATSSLKKIKKKGKGAKAETDDARPWEGKFTATVCKGVDSDKLGRFEITDLRGQEPETWYEDIKCLKCGTTLD